MLRYGLCLDLGGRVRRVTGHVALVGHLGWAYGPARNAASLLDVRQVWDVPGDDEVLATDGRDGAAGAGRGTAPCRSRAGLTSLIGRHGPRAVDVMAYSPLGKPVSSDTAPEPPTKSEPMSPALSRLTSSLMAASVAVPFMYPVALVRLELVKLPPSLQM